MSLTKFCAKQIPKICGRKREDIGERTDAWWCFCLPLLYTSAADLQQRHADKDPGHQGQVVLQPLLKLRHAALHVDVVLLLRILKKQSCPSSSQSLNALRYEKHWPWHAWSGSPRPAARTESIFDKGLKTHLDPEPSYLFQASILLRSWHSADSALESRLMLRLSEKMVHYMSHLYSGKCCRCALLTGLARMSYPHWVFITSSWW